jgi:hypothetical protein
VGGTGPKDRERVRIPVGVTPEIVGPARQFRAPELPGEHGRLPVLSERLDLSARLEDHAGHRLPNELDAMSGRREDEDEPCSGPSWPEGSLGGRTYRVAPAREAESLTGRPQRLGNVPVRGRIGACLSPGLPSVSPQEVTKCT